VIVTAIANPDTIAAVESYTLGANLENGTIGGTLAFNLAGNALGNTLRGNAGANILSGGLGNDTLTGLGGADTFLFNTALNAATNVDRISDFNVPADTIRLENAIFSGLATGALAADAFHIGVAAADAEDRVVYNSATGALFFDTNGNTAGGATQFALLGTGLALTSADFLVV
jgi:serralysin